MMLSARARRPIRLKVGAGESLIQWLLMPNLSRFRKEIPDASVGFLNRRSNKIIEGLIDGDLDLGVVRETAMTKQLAHISFGSFGYKLFVPKKMSKDLADSLSPDEIKDIRIALLAGRGEFRSSVDQYCANTSKHNDIELECSSFTQLAYAVSSLGFAAILPDFVEGIFNKGKVTAHSLKGFKHKRKLVIAWNPRRAESRPVIKKAAKSLKKLLNG